MNLKDKSKKELISIIETLLLTQKAERREIIKVKGFNNSYDGIKSYGGTIFTKATVTVTAVFDGLNNTLYWQTTRLTPSGMRKGGTNNYEGSIILKDEEKEEIAKNGLSKFAIKKLEIPEYIEQDFNQNIFLVKKSN
jgi:hypothetical protein